MTQKKKKPEEMPQKPEEKYLVVGTQLIPVVMLDETWAVPASSLIEIKPENSAIFDNREDANYYKMVKNLIAAFQ